MDSLIKSDIFFFITSIAVVLITLLLAIGLVYAISILHTIEGISKQLKQEADLISQDISDVRNYARGQSWTIMGLTQLFKTIFSRRSGLSKSRKK
jgi:hypothetical protein